MKELPADDLPPEVRLAAERLLKLFVEQGGKVATPAEVEAAGEGLVIEVIEFEEDDLGDDIDDFLEELSDQDAEEQELAAARRAEQLAQDAVPMPSLRVRPIIVQPRLPKIFRLIIENHNARLEIHSKGSAMSQDDWRNLKELHRDMDESLRPGAVRALERGPRCRARARAGAPVSDFMGGHGNEPQRDPPLVWWHWIAFFGAALAFMWLFTSILDGFR